ncbi:MAG TPA: phosphoenolpyruvate carboxykinase domain-containing protein, partial [Solirubrobacteraceae bacterium]|nr:phosphoenolpyruvate carboxykinase domain-containing protein [Solirubrobacteraceae bacterium]
RLPKIFYVNWFRKDADGRFLWPGFGENSRVLAWIFERCAGSVEGVQTPIGVMPADGGIDIDGLEIGTGEMAELLAVDEDQWRAQLPQFREHFAKFERLPGELAEQLDALEARLG